jgi:hypothetical protein
MLTRSRESIAKPLHKCCTGIPHRGPEPTDYPTSEPTSKSNVPHDLAGKHQIFIPCNRTNCTDGESCDTHSGRHGDHGGCDGGGGCGGNGGSYGECGGGKYGHD